MTGIGLITFVCIWGFIAIWIGVKLSNFILFEKFMKNKETGDPTWWNFPVKAVLIIFVFVLPLADEILSYPAYQKLCDNGGKYQFAPGMDEKKAFGRKYFIRFEGEKYIRLFPTIRVLLPSEYKTNGVIVKSVNLKLIDIYTKEIILTSEITVPVRSFFAVPWDGGRITWILQECTISSGKNAEKSQKLIELLQLHRIYL